jgi:hypothetical protein
MVVINISSYPLQSVEACVKCYMELPPLPDFITEKGMYTRFAKGVGIELIHILEFDDSKRAEANEFIGKRILAFSVVPGFSCSSQPWATVEEALKMMG